MRKQKQSSPNNRSAIRFLDGILRHGEDPFEPIDIHETEPEKELEDSGILVACTDLRCKLPLHHVETKVEHDYTGDTIQDPSYFY